MDKVPTTAGLPFPARRPESKSLDHVIHGASGQSWCHKEVKQAKIREWSGQNLTEIYTDGMQNTPDCLKSDK